MPQSLASRLQWLTAVRLAFLSLLLLVVATFYLRGGLENFPVSSRVMFVSIGASYGLAAVYSLVLRWGKGLSWLAEAEVVGDQALATIVVYVTGGVSSGATSLYALFCLTAAILIGLRGAILGAVSGLTFYGLMCASFAFNYLKPPSDQPPTLYITHAEQMVYPLLLSSMGIVVVAALSGYLAERLRRTGGELLVANERVRHAERLAELGKIAAWLAHEIRNPLGSIRGSIEILGESRSFSDEDKSLIDIVHRESRRLNDLVSDMVDLSRPRISAPANVDLAKIASDVVTLAKSTAEDAKIELALQVPDDPVLAFCDDAQMRQVVWNLVRNAVQATPEGSSVTVRVVAKGNRANLFVVDEGPGISSEDAERIFDVFYTKKRSHGAGIGLAVVKQIVDDHSELGASIHVEKNPSGTGAQFRVELPRVRN